MTSDLMWLDPEELRARDDLAAAKRDYQDSLTWPPKPPFDRKDFEVECQLAEQLVELLIQKRKIPPFKRPDERVGVIKRYFLAYADGTDGAYDAESVLQWAEDDIFQMQDNPGSCLLGFQVAKAGFFAMGRPRLARQFAWAAVEAVSYLEALQRQLEASRQQMLKPGGP